MTVKSNLTVLDLHRLVKDVRQRVEHEITFEGLERMTKCVILLVVFTRRPLIPF